MRCVNQEIGKLLLLYTLRKLPPALEDQVRSHLQECDACVEDLMTLHRAGSFFSRYVEDHPEELDSASRVLNRRKRVVTAVSAFAVVLFVGASFLVGSRLFPDRGARNGANGVRQPGASPAPATARAFLVAAAGEMLSGQPGRAKTLLLWAAEWLEAPFDPAVPRLLERAAIQVHLGRHRDALETLESARALGRQLNDPGVIATTLVRTAEILMTGLLDAKNGGSALAQARGAAEIAAVSLIEVRVREAELVQALLVTADYEEALNIARRIISLSSGGVGDVKIRGAGQQALGVAYEAGFVSGRGDEATLADARTAFGAAARIWKRAGDDLWRARALTGLGRVALLRGDPAGALPPLESAATLHQRQGDLRGLALARANVALAQLELGRPEDALASIVLALSEADRSEDPFLQFDARALHGRILLHLNRVPEGQAALRQALEAGALLYPTRIRKEQLRRVETLIATAAAGGVGGPRQAVASGIY